MILATAGVKRLGWQQRITEVIEPQTSLPAIGQGAVGIECRINDEFINKLIAPLNHKETSICVRAERALLKRLQGGCQVPIAGFCTIENDTLTLTGLVASVDGKEVIRKTATGPADQPEVLGRNLAEELLTMGGRAILEEVYGQKIA